MNEELAYSIHLGSDKNRTIKAKEIAKTNPSGTTSFSNNAIQNAKQLSDANKHNLRDYDKNRDDIFVIYGSNNLFNDVRDLYLQEFEQAKLEYNEKQTREDRKINDYFYKISQDSQRDLACEIIIELGDMDFWKDKDMKYKKRMSDVYNEQVKDLMKVVPEFKVANAVIHYDETSPHMHIIGVPVKYDYKKGMKKQVAKSQIFTKSSLKVILSSNQLDVAKLEKMKDSELADLFYEISKGDEFVNETEKDYRFAYEVADTAEDAIEKTKDRKLSDNEEILELRLQNETEYYYVVYQEYISHRGTGDVTFKNSYLYFKNSILDIDNNY